ncbi:aminotransferase class I/II-fold pyridoxal phosphate-dependent enzyme [Variovorax sp. VNK109]|jgi:cystathionine beta-lyase|uniref:aminotransferase class I/II-fold pyridoxal phosphate-dependent enzyme n=1 Tax=Variovorax sp. VNK109 TaxID=3400919 RepID=UPI003C106EAE
MPAKTTSTQLIHHPYEPPAGFAAPQPGVFKASTVVFPSVAAMRARDWKSRQGYTYGLHGTPTTFTLEERLCALEGGKQCLLVPSGLAAISVVALALLKNGDEVLIPDNAYGPSKALAEGELAAFGITHQLYDALDPADLAARISDRTQLVWLEAAGSVTMEFPDLPALVRICRDKGVLTALDNTWGAGLAFAPFDFGAVEARVGVDISAHALTKYPSGGGDVLMGSVITRDEALHLRLKLAHMRLGFGVGANDVESVLRSLPSLPLRYAAHDRTARELAHWLAGQKEIVQVLHPAMQGSPGHAHWRALCAHDGGAGLAAGLFSIILDERFNQAQVDRFCDSLKLFKLGYSWGGPVSLVVPYELAAMRPQWPPHIRRGTLVRFSVGLETVDDLQADLAEALGTMAS